ncbi:hypothetical protein G9A89_016051 [Geosiphon pyriformis]|nr:hypothetical protein G9A89_016051 [Geosiphon pyriformis]
MSGKEILLACSTHDILYEDNFSVLKGTTTQTPIFAIGSVVENPLEKNRNLWLILQDMQKAYNSHQKSVYGYKLNSYFVSRSGRSEFQAGLSFFFAAGAFVDDTIWVGSNQAATQHILNIASEFFRINNISINNDKTMTISINSRISNQSLFISGSPIFIAKKGESYWYFGIFLSTDGLSKPSLAKAHLDICFFSNLVLRKVVSNKQFLYLVSAVLYPIISYRIQFSFVSVGVYNKWDTLIFSWHKVKGHSGILENECANSFADAAFLSGWFLPSYVSEYFLVANDGIVSGNSRHFVWDVFRAVCHVR